MPDFLATHRPLIQRLARTYVREHPESVSRENIAREIEIILTQLEWAHSISLNDVASPMLYIRSIMKHAASRAKRRNSLVQQVGAGDDLEEMARNLQKLDADLPDPPPQEPSRESVRRREMLTALFSTLPARVALIGALWMEDRGGVPEIATVLAVPEAEVEVAIELTKSAGSELEAPPSSSPSSVPKPETREQELRDFADRAADPVPPGDHIDASRLALVRDGDLADDLESAFSHLGLCPLCRARLAQGATATRSVVVLAIEAPKSSARELQKAAGAANARLYERGSGRWTAVVDADQASALAGELEKPDSSIVNRLAMGAPVDVTTRDNATLPPPRSSGRDSMLPGSGTTAAELDAWVQVGRIPQQYAPASFSLGWLSFVILTTTGSAALAYYLATR